MVHGQKRTQRRLIRTWFPPTSKPVQTYSSLGRRIPLLHSHALERSLHPPHKHPPPQPDPRPRATHAPALGDPLPLPQIRRWSRPPRFHNRHVRRPGSRP